MKVNFEKPHKSVVIGASGSIGRACVTALSKAGADVIAIDLSNKNNIPSEKFIKCDVTSLADIISSSKKFEKLDSVIYAVGLNYDGNVVDTNWDDYKRLMSVNLDGAFYVGSVYGKKMIEQGAGSFVFLSSFAGLRGEAGAAAYCASKFGLIGFVESFAAEMTSHNIRVNAISPGNVDSPMLENVAEQIAIRTKSSTAEVYNEMKTIGAAKRFVLPSEVANLAVYLSSELSSGITGSIVKIDCGAGLDG